VIEMMANDTDALEADINAPDKQGWSPLFHACSHLASEAKKKGDGEQVNTAVLTTLLKVGADLEHYSNQGWNLLHLAAHNDSKAVLEAVVSLHKAAHRNDSRAIDAFVNHADVDGRVPLHIASFRASDSVVKFLLENHANPDCADSHSNTPQGLAEKVP
jgi:ankyrin repeat protein